MPGKNPPEPPGRSIWDDPAMVDEALVESFPASDPPAWTLGIERKAPAASGKEPAEARDAGARTPPRL